MVYDLVDVVLDEKEEEVPSLRNTRLRVCVSCVCVMCVCHVCVCCGVRVPGK